TISRPSGRAVVWTSRISSRTVGPSTLAKIANRRRPGTNSRKSSSRLAATSVCWIDRPVTLPPGRAKLATRPVPTGSPAAAKTIGMTDVACLAATIAAVADVTMTSTLRRTNSAAISSKRSVRPSAQRYSIATVRPSIQPSSCNRRTKAANHWPWDEGVPATSSPMIGSFADCCARREGPRRGRAAEQREEGASPHGGPFPRGLAAARYHTVAPERRCASQQKLRADVADGVTLGHSAMSDQCPDYPGDLNRSTQHLLILLDKEVADGDVTD